MKLLKHWYLPSVLTCVVFLSSAFSLFSQADSCRLRISLLTCSPGQELYSSWGHTAIRVTDSATGTDIVYNYGTFDDSDPLFLFNFTKGLMIYALSSYPFSDFVLEYQSQGRGVIEQKLEMNCSEKQKLYSALQINNLQENRFYNYYFHTDNCTSRARDMIVKNTGDSLKFKPIISTPPPSYRNLIHVYLDNSLQYWNKFGIDILLGANLDKKVSNYDAMFLPDYLMKGFDSSSVNNKPFVSESRTVLPITLPAPEKPIFTPFVLFLTIAIAIAFLSMSKAKWLKTSLFFFDLILFLTLGVLGCLLVILWIIRIDDVCRNNYNLLWALPTHLPIAFFVFSKKDWVRRYFRLVFFLTILLAICWWLIPQQFNAALVPILLLIALRAWVRSKN